MGDEIERVEFDMLGTPDSKRILSFPVVWQSELRDDVSDTVWLTPNGDLIVWHGFMPADHIDIYSTIDELFAADVVDAKLVAEAAAAVARFSRS